MEKCYSLSEVPTSSIYPNDVSTPILDQERNRFHVESQLDLFCLLNHVLMMECGFDYSFDPGEEASEIHQLRQRYHPMFPRHPSQDLPSKDSRVCANLKITSLGPVYLIQGTMQGPGISSKTFSISEFNVKDVVASGDANGTFTVHNLRHFSKTFKDHIALQLYQEIQRKSLLLDLPVLALHNIKKYLTDPRDLRRFTIACSSNC